MQYGSNPKPKIYLLALQPRLDRAILVVEVVHIRNQVLHHVHMRQRVHLGRLVQIVGIDLADARQRVRATDIHGTRTADTLAARPTERQRWVDFVLDLNQGVQHHRTTGIQIHLVGLKRWLFCVIEWSEVIQAWDALTWLYGFCSGLSGFQR